MIYSVQKYPIAVIARCGPIKKLSYFPVQANAVSGADVCLIPAIPFSTLIMLWIPRDFSIEAMITERYPPAQCR